MTRVFTASPATTDSYALGEGPVWDAARQRLLWVDIVAGTVHEGRLDTAAGTIIATGSWSFAGTVGAVAVAATGELLVAEQTTLTMVDTHGRRTHLAEVLPPGVRSRLNDGAVDPAGRFLVGTLAQDGRRGRERLVRLEETGCVALDTDLTLSNGLAWSPSGEVFYSIDTIPGIVWARTYDAATGSVGERRVVLDIDDGLPDGLCVDAAGNLWIAIWGRGRIECRSPAGEFLARVAVDAPHTTSVTFAGPGLDVLVVTTATEELGPDQLARHPASGRLFTARVDARGLPPSYWQPLERWGT